MLKGIDVLNRDIEYIKSYSDSADLVYFDPPYEPVSPTSDFTEYSADGFGRDDQKRLMDIIDELDKKSVYVIISNSGVMYDHYSDKGYNVESVNASRSINSDPDKRGDVEEIIASNIPGKKRNS